RDINVADGIFDRIVEKVRNGGAKLFGIALHFDFGSVHCGLVAQSSGFKVVARSGKIHTLADKISEIDFGAENRRRFVPALSGGEHLLDGAEEAVGIEKHQLVEFLALLV